MNFRYYKTNSLTLFLLVMYIIATKLIGDKLLPEIQKLPGIIRQIIDVVGIISPVAFIALVIWFIDRTGWKYRAFNWLINLPDMNGRYEGFIISDFHKNAEGNNLRHAFAIEIMQTASSLVIASYYINPIDNQETSAISIVEHIEISKNGLAKIYFVYENEASKMKSIDVEPFGSSFFTYSKTIRKISGGYYNRRPHTGSFEASFVTKTLFQRYIK